MKTLVTYYKGVLRSQFATCKRKEFGKEHRSIFSHIEMQPKFELFLAQEVDEKEYNEWVANCKNSPHLHKSEKEIVEYYNDSDAKDGKRLYSDEIWMGLNTLPHVVDQPELEWEDLHLNHAPDKYLHDCFIAYVPGSNHGRICGPAMIKRTRHLDEKGVEVFQNIGSVESREVILERQGCFQNARGCTRRVYGFNLGIKNWVNSLFGGVFGSNLIGNEPNGCVPSLLPSGCSGAGCQRFGCGWLGILFSLAILLWLFRCILFGECSGSNDRSTKVVERIVHDTVYIQKDAKVDTLTYVDETTNTTVKMLSLPNVQFEKAKALLLRSSLPQLNELATYLIENKDLNAEIIGHTDSDGDAEVNRQLSQERAEAVRQYLIQNGVDASRIKATGNGESEPVTENLTPEGRAMNRRVEVRLSQSTTTKTVRTKKESKR